MGDGESAEGSVWEARSGLRFEREKRRDQLYTHCGKLFKRLLGPA
jgi:hypothetical protein